MWKLGWMNLYRHDIYMCAPPLGGGLVEYRYDIYCTHSWHIWSISMIDNMICTKKKKMAYSVLRACFRPGRKRIRGGFFLLKDPNH